MMREPRDRAELVGALLGADIEADAMRRVYAGDHDDWMTALESTGLFDLRALAEIASSWAADPRVLRDALLAEADEFTRRRCLAEWAALERGPVVAVGR
ncbi:hypothetical protein AB0I35_09830 [Nocardia sp. NPDC050378]